MFSVFFLACNCAVFVYLCAHKQVTFLNLSALSSTPDVMCYYLFVCIFVCSLLLDFFLLCVRD